MSKNPFPQYGTASTYYNPDTLFQSNLSDLAPDFANQRYNSFKDFQGSMDVSRNHTAPEANFGTVKIYNRNSSTSPYSTSSHRIYNKRDTNYGDTEPRLMLEGLKRVYNQDSLNPRDNPDLTQQYNQRSLNIEEPLESLVRNPGDHRKYLENTKRYIDMLSERPSCTTRGGAGGCSQFMRGIAPMGSKFGHTVSYNNELTDPQNVENAIERLGPAYRDYLNSNRLPSLAPNKIGGAFGIREKRISSTNPINPIENQSFFGTSVISPSRGFLSSPQATQFSFRPRGGDFSSRSVPNNPVVNTYSSPYKTPLVNSILPSTSSTTRREVYSPLSSPVGNHSSSSVNTPVVLYNSPSPISSPNYFPITPSISSSNSWNPSSSSGAEYSNIPTTRYIPMTRQQELDQLKTRLF